MSLFRNVGLGAAAVGLLALANGCTSAGQDADESVGEAAQALPTFSLGATSCGFHVGYCNCVKHGSIGVADPNRADALCRDFGFTRAQQFEASQSPGAGERICTGLQGGCFINANPGNLICTSVTCE